MESMITMTIYDEVFAAAKTQGVKEQNPNFQSDQDFLFSIAKALSTCPVEVWNGLQPESKLWYDEAVKTHNAMQPIPFPAGFKGTPMIIELPAQVQAPVVHGAVIRNLPPPAPTPIALMQSKARSKPEGVVGAIRKTIILNHDWPTRKVHEFLVANGWPQLKLDVVSVNAGDIRRTVEMVKALNKWKD